MLEEPEPDVQNMFMSICSGRGDAIEGFRRCTFHVRRAVLDCKKMYAMRSPACQCTSFLPCRCTESLYSPSTFECTKEDVPLDDKRCTPCSSKNGVLLLLLLLSFFSFCTAPPSVAAPVRAVRHKMQRICRSLSVVRSCTPAVCTKKSTG